MLSGRRLDLLDPSPLDIEIEDIAHGLARVARWNGQTKGAHIFSVAQHSLLTEAIARQQSRLDRSRLLAILLHDAPEYVIGDMISPFKAVIGNDYKAVEARRFFGPPPKFSAVAERDYLTPWSAEVAQTRYLQRFAKISPRFQAPAETFRNGPPIA